MTDPTTRDQIVEIVRDNLDGIPREAIPGDVADVLIEHGLVVPAGMTAEKLREVAWIIDADDPDDPNNPSEIANQVRAWADVLELRETREGAQ